MDHSNSAAIESLSDSLSLTGALTKPNSASLLDSSSSVTASSSTSHIFLLKDATGTCATAGTSFSLSTAGTLWGSADRSENFFLVVA